MNVSVPLCEISAVIMDTKSVHLPLGQNLETTKVLLDVMFGDVEEIQTLKMKIMS